MLLVCRVLQQLRVRFDSGYILSINRRSQSLSDKSAFSFTSETRPIKILRTSRNKHWQDHDVTSEVRTTVSFLHLCSCVNTYNVKNVCEQVQRTICLCVSFRVLSTVDFCYGLGSCVVCTYFWKNHYHYSDTGCNQRTSATTKATAVKSAVNNAAHPLTPAEDKLSGRHLSRSSFAFIVTQL